MQLGSPGVGPRLDERRRLPRWRYPLFITGCLVQRDESAESQRSGLLVKHIGVVACACDHHAVGAVSTGFRYLLHYIEAERDVTAEWSNAPRVSLRRQVWLCCARVPPR